MVVPSKNKSYAIVGLNLTVVDDDNIDDNDDNEDSGPRGAQCATQ